MARFKLNFDINGLATKQFLFLSFVTISLFSILAYKTLNDTGTLFKQEKIRVSMQLVERTNQYLSVYVENINTTLLLLANRYDLFQPGNDEAAIAYLDDYGADNVGVAKSFYIIRKDGAVFSSKQLFYEILGNPMLEQVAQFAYQNYGGINWTEPYTSPVSGWTVAFAKPVIYKGEDLGVAVVEINLEKLAGRISPQLLNDKEAYSIMTANGNVVVLEQQNENLLLPQNELVFYPQELQPGFVEQLFRLQSGIDQIQGLQGSLLTIKSDANRLGWNILVFIDEHSFYDSLAKLYANYRYAVSFWVVVLLISAFAISRYFTRPIRILVAKMDRVDNIELLPAIHVRSKDEIGKLAASFNGLMERINLLVKELKKVEEVKKQYEFKMLLSQIGPHFLYNTLACIGSLAKQQRIHEVRETIRSLIGLLSFSFNKTSELVTLGDELEGLRMYCQIQNIRYEDKFTLTLEIPPELHAFPMLKLTLQPLVENSIFHGIIAGHKHGHIRIVGRIRKEQLRIYVIDNGVGMNRDIRRSLLDKRSDDFPNEAFNRLGVINVHERIQLYFGKMYGLHILSSEKRGTFIRIDFPCIPKQLPPQS